MDVKSFRVNIGIVVIILAVIMTMDIMGTGFCDPAPAPSAAPASSGGPDSQKNPAGAGAGQADQPAQQAGGVSIELNGDTVEYSVEGNKLIAQGNVVIYYKEVTLTCDRLEFSRDTSVAHADGHVHMTQGHNEFSGEKMTFNFQTMQGEFEPAAIFSDPYYGKGEQMAKVGENHIAMKNGYLTTCDLDDPHYRLISRTLDIYPKDKMVARSVRMKVGKVPLIYLPRFTQDLTGKRPLVTFTPGYDKQWGMFLLTAIRADLNDNVKGTIHFDAREKKDVASGFDVSYKTPHAGSGTIRTYYMNERSITSRHFYQPRPSPTVERERFKGEWRHKWDIDAKTNAIWQYYKLSDNTLLKDYYKREFDKDSAPTTFFLLTRTLPAGMVSFRTDVRVNRFESKIERLPELRYDLSTLQLGETGFYFRDVSTYTSLASVAAAPTQGRLKTIRFDTDNELSYPFKLGFIELKPFVGGENTYYSRTKDPDNYDSIRGIFRTGASLSTKFYKIFDVEMKEWGLDIHRLRHIITPSVSYAYAHTPTLSSDRLDSYDAIDSKSRSDSINFSLENKLQTKRHGEVIELLRAVLGTDFALKDNPGTGGFNTITTKIDFRPVDRVTFYFDSSYDTRADYLTTANFDMYINGGKNWWTSIGKRWNREVDDQVTTEFGYKINPKWAVKLYNRFDVRKGLHKEQQYTLTRDLHEWSMDINFNETRGSGDEIWIVFTLKAFPEMALDLGGAGFNKRKAGSQSSGGN